MAALEELDRDRPLFDKVVPVLVRRGATTPQQSTPSELTIRVLAGHRVSDNQKDALLHIEVTDEADPFFLFTLDVTEDEFHGLKHDQSLLVDFASFPPKFIELLEQCSVAHAAAEEARGHGETTAPPRFVAVLAQTPGTGGARWQLQIIETNLFKHLTHLSLHFQPGNDSSIQRYLAARLNQVKAQRDTLRREQRATRAELAAASGDAERLRAEGEAARARQGQALSELRAEHDRALATHKEDAAYGLADAQARAAKESRLRHERDAQRLAQVEAAHAAARQENKRLVERVHALENRGRELGARVEADEGRLSAGARELAALRAGNAELDARRFELEKALNQGELRAAALEQQAADRDELDANRGALLDAANARVAQQHESLALYKRSCEQLQRKLEQSADEINKGNAIIARLQGEHRAQRAKIKTKGQVVRQQERALQDRENAGKELERQVAALEGQLQTQTERAGGLEQQLEGARRKLKESSAMLQSNQNVIAYLNKEINSLQMGRFSARESTAYAFAPSAGGGGGGDLGGGGGAVDSAADPVLPKAFPTLGGFDLSGIEAM